LDEHHKRSSLKLIHEPIGSLSHTKIGLKQREMITNEGVQGREELGLHNTKGIALTTL
jgi:hypothetical protein